MKRLGKAGGGGAAGAAGGGGAGGVKTSDLGSIRELVQKLCQSSHPLAKSMDYLAEDLENMAKEIRYRAEEDKQRLLNDALDTESRILDGLAMGRDFRDATWSAVVTIQSEVMVGTLPMPATIADYLAILPSIPARPVIA